MSNCKPIEIADEVEVMRLRILELEARNRVLERLAATDELTGLLNRRAFNSRLSEEISRCVRYDRSISLLCIDLDGLKAVNDGGGHAAGDDLLKRAAEALRAAVRQTDIIARLGGDEFAVILPDTNLKGACKAAERIRIRVFESSRPQHEVTASIGVVTRAAGIVFAEEFIDEADKQLYRAKKLGGNRVCK